MIDMLNLIAALEEVKGILNEWVPQFEQRNTQAAIDLAIELLKQERIDKLCNKYGLTPSGIEHALDQYQRIICDITHGTLSKLTYDADTVLQCAQQRWCDTCDLKEQTDREDET